MTPICEHLDFAAEVDVNRIEDTGGFSADIRIRCLACDEPFVFVGSLLSGLSPREPTVKWTGASSTPTVKASS